MATKVQHLKVDIDLKQALVDVVTQLAAATTALNALRTDHNTLVAKLNLDAGVTDTDYAASTASAVAESATVL